ncbi:MAG: serine/arginine repetitive matrix protein 2 [Sphaerisporangium sp.]|nr:serine/arginine repetitive matrix protein 2 [Sphaerisporangium sp.]
MGSVVTSLVAILGTLLGATVTYVFQMRTAKQARQSAREERLWQERLAAYSAFAGALTDFRKSQNDRWHREQEDSQSAAYATARDDSYRQRANATAALFRLRLVTTNQELDGLASLALRLAEEIHEATDEQDRTDRGRKARRALLDFAQAAAADVQKLDV